MFNKSDSISDFDPELWASMQEEEQRQEHHVELIASENYTSNRVLQAQGSVLTNKYAEGYPGKRYYGGCEFVDKAEVLAIDRAKQLFGADYANVQPHSGSQANAAVYQALVTPGAEISKARAWFSTRKKKIGLFLNFFLGCFSPEKKKFWAFFRCPQDEIFLGLFFVYSAFSKFIVILIFQ